MQMNLINPKTLDTYYAVLAAYRAQGVGHESALRHAFASLLDTLSKNVGWTLVLEQKLSNRKRPDGTLYDAFKIPRGYWEAKDTQDDLDAEIRAKIQRGYPLTNIIFEDTQRAVLYQNGRLVLDADIRQPHQLAFLLNQFFNHTEAQIEQFHRAVQEFQARIPELARGLMQRVHDERGDNPTFVAAFNQFHELCKNALNPNIGAAAIEEMLVQHLLTERLFRTVFDNPDFTSRNVIAAEIETVIRALTSRAFNRREFLKSLDYFYLAIEEAAKTIDDFAEKQTFLNTVYERFFQGFSRQQADTHGIVYTPQAIVDFLCASVEEVLQREFGTSLSHPDVKILDPCVGTGNFIVNLLHRINRRDLPRKYKEELFCNEIMLLPYYIASLNIEHAYYELTGGYEPFEGICFADTLDLAESKQLAMFTEKNTERVQRQKDATITVIIGNPPYNVGQMSEHDQAKNRKYPVVDGRVRETYAKDSKATNKNALSDPYVKFFRWATDRLEKRDGIVCFVSNNSFLDQHAFDGMRKHLLQDFTQIYHLDLHGNVRKNPKLSGTTHNVFGIQVGVGITIAVRCVGAKHYANASPLLYHRVPEDWRKTEKLEFLAKAKSISGVEWQTPQPDDQHRWLTEGLRPEFATFLPMGTKETKSARNVDVEAIFKNYGRGVATSRDDWAYDFDRAKLVEKIQRLIENYNSEVDRWKRRSDKTVSVDDFVSYDDTRMKWSRDLKLDLQRGRYAEFAETKIRNALYRPFCKQFRFLDRVLNEEVYISPSIFPTPESEVENTVIWLKVGSEVPMFALMTNVIPDLMPQGGTQCFPFYIYAEDGSGRRENITDWALGQFQARYGAEVTKRDVFHYVYAVLHHPQYRERYAENLKRELPRIPLVGNEEIGKLGNFRRMVEIGRQLATLHLNYEQAAEYPLKWVENRDVPFSWKVKQMRLTPDKTAVVVNESLTLAGIPPECFAYRLGNRSALEWVIDQYQIRTDKRSGITTDPNRPDNEEYIVRLIGKVVTVSVETVRWVEGLKVIEL